MVALMIQALLAGAGCSDDGDPVPPDGAADAADSGFFEGGTGEAGADTSVGKNATIQGTVSLRPDIFPPPPGDLAGPVYVGVLSGPPELGGMPVKLDKFTADFSSGPVQYSIAEIPPGKYMVSALFDDNGNFSPSAPMDAGDIVNPLMIPIELKAGQQLKLDLILDTPVPPTKPYCGDEPLDATERQCIFDFIWEFANRYNPFLTLKAVDWQAVKTQYQPLVAQQGTDQEFHLLMAQLLAELRDAHSGIGGSLILSHLGLKATVSGVKLTWVNGEVYVEWLKAGSAAETAGLQAGDHVLKIDDKTFTSFQSSVGGYFAHPNDHHYYATLANAWLAGDQGTTAKIEIERGAATVNVPRSVPTSSTDPLVTSSRLTGKSGKEYGYVRIRSFAEKHPEVVTLFDKALDGLLDVSGLILDLRENSGGLSSYGFAMVSRLIDKPKAISHHYYRGSLTEYVAAMVQPGNNPYLGPIVVLTDEHAYSNGHTFSTELKGIGRATLVGRTTGGGSATPEMWLLSTALQVGMSKALTTSVSGTIDEELGVKPDLEVSMTVTDLESGLYQKPGTPQNDIVLQKAIEKLGD